MRVGLTGFSGSGRSTVFSALTGLASKAATGDRRPQLGTIKVPDPRVDTLAALWHPKKTTYADIQFVDFPPPRQAPERRAVLDAETVVTLKDVDALVEVVRGFPDVAGTAATPAADVEGFGTELVLADLAVLERRLERLRKEPNANPHERALVERLIPGLEGGQPLRMVEVTADERALLAGFSLLSLRPLLVVLNVAEADVAAALPADVAAAAAGQGAEAIALSAQVEAEVAELDEADRPAFLADLGLTETARDRFVRASYGLLDLISFLTTGEDECRAWPIRRGTTAVRAAGKIHSDIERGFIRAEVIGWDDFTKHGTEAKCREAGRFRLEGKDYVVEDGDIVHFRFAV